MQFSDPEIANMFARTALNEYYQKEVELNDPFLQRMDAFEKIDLQMEIRRTNEFRIKETEKIRNMPKIKKIKSNFCWISCFGSVGFVTGCLITIFIANTYFYFTENRDKLLRKPGENEINELLITLEQLLMLFIFFSMPFFIAGYGSWRGYRVQLLPKVEKIRNKINILDYRRLRLEEKLNSIKREIIKHEVSTINHQNAKNQKIVLNLRVVQKHFEELLKHHYKLIGIPFQPTTNMDGGKLFSTAEKTKDIVSQLEAIQLNPHLPEHYHELAQVLREGDKIEVPDQGIMSKQELFVQAIQLDSNCLEAYIGLANTLREGECIDLPDGRKMNKFELLKEMLQLKSLSPPLQENCEVMYEFDITDLAKKQLWNLTLFFTQENQSSEMEDYLPSKLANLSSLPNALCWVAQQIDAAFNKAIKKYRKIFEKANNKDYKQKIVEINNKEIKRMNKAVKLIKQRLKVVKANLDDFNINIVNLIDRNEKEQLDALLKLFDNF